MASFFNLINYFIIVYNIEQRKKEERHELIIQ